jgi:hypothetical protein
MKRKRLERAAVLAVDLACELDARLPECCAVEPGELLAAVMPLAVHLERLERKAARNGKHAKRYRKAARHARREVSALLASQDGSAAAVSALLRSVPMDAASWRVALVAGVPAHELAREAQRPEAEAA